jgi:hypothetical protein
MAKPTNLGVLTNKVYDLLHELEPADRAKVMNSIADLFGDQSVSLQPSGQGSHGNSSGQRSRLPDQGSSNPQQFFVQKAPQNKGEMLAVAARYREQQGGASSHTADDLARYFSEARQNFDRRNFARDMKNAQNQSLLFNKGTPRGQYQLSYFGQQYVDALPDREAVKNVRRPGHKNGKRKAGKKVP